MRLPTFLYRSERIGKNGKVFSVYKIRTLKEGIDKTSSFAKDDQYLKYGKFLRKYKLDELGQILNILKGNMRIVGPRPELKESIHLIPKDIRDIILSVKPGLTSLASIHFFNEESMLGKENSHENYWTKIKPMKILLDVYYVQHRSFLLDWAIIYGTAKLLFKTFIDAKIKRK